MKNSFKICCIVAFNLINQNVNQKNNSTFAYLIPLEEYTILLWSLGFSINAIFFSHSRKKKMLKCLESLSPTSTLAIVTKSIQLFFFQIRASMI